MKNNGVRAAWDSMKKAIPLLIIIALFTTCSVNLESSIPQYLDEKHEAGLKEKFVGKAAFELFYKDKSLNELIREFAPVDISAGIYNYGGIIIFLGIARFNDQDEAFGVYSGLTSMPRERWSSSKGELSYKNPYFAGQLGRYAFWFYSPTNPGTYTHFYKIYGDALLEKLNIGTDAALSYHWKLLPEENRFRDSVFYIRARDMHGIRINNAYGAVYQAGRNKGYIYIEKHYTEKNAELRMEDLRDSLTDSGQVIQKFPSLPGGPAGAISWTEGGSINVIYRYRWMTFILIGMPDKGFAENFIRNIYKNMIRIRSEVVPAKKSE